MDRRNFIAGAAVTLCGVSAAEAAKTEAHSAPVDLFMLLRMLAMTTRFEMSPAQWTVYSMLRCEAEQHGDVATETMNALPVSVNPSVPKDEIWLVAHDGTVMSKLTGLAIPNGF